MSLAESLKLGARRAVHIRFSTVCYQPEKSGKFKIVREKGIIKENRRYSCRGKMDYLS